jgi:hypothetical protein
MIAARSRVAADLAEECADVGIRAKLGWLLTFLDRQIGASSPSVSQSG